MSYEQLIAEHARIAVKAQCLTGFVAAPEPDLAAVAIALDDLTGELIGHLAHGDSFLYPQMIAARDTELADAASAFLHDFATLRSAWDLYYGKWSSGAIAGDWQGFRAETDAILARLARRIRAEDDLLYPAAFRQGLIPLRGAA